MGDNNNLQGLSAGMTPVERRILTLARRGLDVSEIAVRFRRSPGYVRRVLEIAELRRDAGSELSTSAGGEGRSQAGTPRQRIILRWRQKGASYAEIASRLRRSPSYVRRIEALASLRQA